MTIQRLIGSARAYAKAALSALSAVFRGSGSGEPVVPAPLDVDAVRDTVTISKAARLALAARATEMDARKGRTLTDVMEEGMALA